MRLVRRAWHAGHVALDLRIERDPVFSVLLLLLSGPRLVWDVVAFHHAAACRDAEARAESGHRTLTRRMILKIPVGRVDRLPDAGEIGVAVSGSRRSIRRRSDAGLRRSRRLG